MKKAFLIILLIGCIAFLSCCTKVDDESITGDVKQGTQPTEDAVPEQNNNGDEQDENGGTSSNKFEYETEETIKKPEKQPDKTQESEETVAVTPLSLIESFGAFSTEGGEYHAQAELFAKCVEFKQLDTVAEFTGGKAEYYNFLNAVEIDGFEIYPFDISSEKVSEIEKNTESYYNDYDMYLVDFNVVKGDGEYFTEGSCIYFMGFGQDPLAGGILSEFVKAEDTMEYIFFKFKKDIDYDMFFVKEFISLYRGELMEGKNYPSSFDFSTSVHLVTHLMARSGKYPDHPPYTMEEINEFLSLSFDGNKGIELLSARDFESWMVGNAGWVTDEHRAEDRLYGCAYAHGGTTAENFIESIEYDGECTKYVTLTLFSDYAHFAKAKKFVFTFEERENELPKLMLVTSIEDKGTEIAYVSV